MFIHRKTAEFPFPSRALMVFFFTFMIMMSMAEVSFGANAPSIQINQQPISMPSHETPAFISEHGRTMVPLRVVSEALNASVDWHAPSQTVTILLQDTLITLVPGKSTAFVNLTALPLEAPAVIVNSRAFVPLRFVAEAFAADVHWDQDNRLISITTNPVIDTVSYTRDLLILPNLPVAHITLTNPKSNETVFWLGHSLLNPLNQWIDIPAIKITLSAHETRTITREIYQEYIPQEKLLSGTYEAVFALWHQEPSNSGAERFSTWRQQDAFRIYRHEENFNTLDPEIWFSRDGQLGRSKLNPQNVTVQNATLQIKLPRNTVQGGELQSLKKFHYGSFEASMKLPNAPSSITGFFLYKAPDFDHEIDIEIYNRKNTEVMFTTYANGGVAREAVFPLSFDPTAAFHRYRFDYTPEAVSFYIDDMLIQQWTGGYSQEPMFLIVNAWHPFWLAGTPPLQDQHLLVEWLRY